MNLTDITGFAKATWLHTPGAEADIELTIGQQDLLDQIEHCEHLLIRGVPRAGDVIIERDTPNTRASDGIHRFSGTWVDYYNPQIHGNATPLIKYCDGQPPSFFYIEGRPYVRKLATGFKIRIPVRLAVNMRPGDVVRAHTHNRLFLLVDRIEHYKKKDGTLSENYIWLHCSVPTWVKLM